MSVKVSSWVWHDATKDVAGNELILLLALADVADDNGRCRYLTDDRDLTYEGLARKVRVDRRTIERLIPKLRDRGLVGHRRGAKGRPNEFAIAVPWAAVSTDNLSENGSESTDTVSVDEADSPTAVRTFTDTVGSRSSYRRKDVTTDVVPALKRGTRIPQPFVVTGEMVAWAREHAPLVDGALSTQRFENYWIAKTGRDATKLDWVRTWQNWLLKDQADAAARGGRKVSTVEHGRRVDQIIRDRAGEQKAIAS